MYRAKEETLGLEVFDPAMHERAIDRLDIENDLRRAVGANEFVLHYQPMVDLRTDEVCGVEALVRWEHPERGLLVPAEFVPVAEESGLVVALGEMVFGEGPPPGQRVAEDPPYPSTCRLREPLRRADSVARTGRDGRAGARETGFRASSLRLDVTETVYISALDAKPPPSTG